MPEPRVAIHRDTRRVIIFPILGSDGRRGGRHRCRGRAITVALGGCTATLPAVPVEAGPDDGAVVDAGTLPRQGDAGARPPDAGRILPPPPESRCVDVARGATVYRVCLRRERWADARAICQAGGLDLMVPDSMEENVWVWERARDIEVAPYWIGLSDLEQEGAFVGVDGRPARFDGWDRGEPNNTDDEDCIQLLDDAPRWNDIDCRIPYPYICESPCVPAAEDTCFDGRDDDCDGVVDEGCLRCDEREHAGRTYLFCGDAHDWKQARAQCQGVGADLAILDDPDESRWVWETAVGIAGEGWWIGLSDLDDEGRWLWVDGRSPSHTQWARRQPDDFLDGEDCCELWPYRRGTWNDNNCERRLGFVCER